MHLQIFDAGLRSERYFYENFKDASHLVGTNTHKSNITSGDRAYSPGP
jgi:hypothetical protein